MALFGGPAWSFTLLLAAAVVLWVWKGDTVRSKLGLKRNYEVDL